MIWSWPSVFAAWCTSGDISLWYELIIEEFIRALLSFFIFSTLPGRGLLFCLTAHIQTASYSLPNNMHPGSMCNRSSAADSVKVRHCWRYNISWKCHTESMEEVSSAWDADISLLRSKLSHIIINDSCAPRSRLLIVLSLFYMQNFWFV